MRRQRYDNEALYPYNGPVTVKRRASRIQDKKKESMRRRSLQLKMQLQIA
jgi:hypothetical protein